MTNTELSKLVQAMGRRAKFRQPKLPQEPGQRPEEIAAYLLQLFDHVMKRLESVEDGPKQ